jgi:hypothetical protein
MPAIYAPLPSSPPSDDATDVAATPFAAMSFTRAMQESVSAAGAGEYYEMGGCWMFAAALHQELVAVGYTPLIVWRPEGFVHAWVRLADRDLDYRGVFRAAPGAEPVASRKALEELALQVGGVSSQDFADGVEAARYIVRQALAEAP